MAFAGGKGRASRKTPQQIEQFGEQMSLSSRAIDDMADMKQDGRHYAERAVL
ncbi:MAG: hypothetical protein KAW39_02505 [Thermoplasmata archaeon]|nr:hypothetical protein [Thermoplasmata archaeon]